jgi:hypothetical protein
MWSRYHTDPIVDRAVHRLGSLVADVVPVDDDSSSAVGATETTPTGVPLLCSITQAFPVMGAVSNRSLRSHVPNSYIGGRRICSRMSRKTLLLVALVATASVAYALRR